jgi:hypothetical protein
MYRCVLLIIGDIIHLIGYYPHIQRPTTTSSTTTTTQRPVMFDSGGQNNNNRPSYYKPPNQFTYQNEWNYESNHISNSPQTNYPTYQQSPLSFNHDYQFNRPTHSTQHQPQYSGFVDDSGYAISPSAVVSHDRPTNHNHRPVQSPPSRPTYNDYDDDFNGYASREGTFRYIHLNLTARISALDI